MVVGVMGGVGGPEVGAGERVGDVVGDAAGVGGIVGVAVVVGEGVLVLVIVGVGIRLVTGTIAEGARPAVDCTR
jgi:hypothetical protein